MVRRSRGERKHRIQPHGDLYGSTRYLLAVAGSRTNQNIDYQLLHEDILMKREPRGKFDRTKMIAAGQVELPPEQHQEAVRQTALADEECRINFRWGTAQLDIIKQVAGKMGVSYQQYIKQVLYRQACSDLQYFNHAQPVVHRQQLEGKIQKRPHSNSA